MYVVITGGGKIGQYLAISLLKEGNQVAVIEESEKVARYLSESLTGSHLVICGDGCEVTNQEDAGVQNADIFVATTGQDEDNLAACEIANRIYNVSRCIARVNNPKNLRIFRRLGIESISSTAIIARMIEEEATLSSMSVAFSLTSDQVSLIEIMVPRMRNNNNEEGVRAVDIEFDEGIRMVAVSHSDEIQVVNEDTRVYPGDQVIIASDTDMLGIARETIRAL